MTERTLFERADERDRHETAALLRKLANDLDGGRELVFDEDVSVAVPERLDVEVEVETEAADAGDEPDGFEVEVELEWDADDVVERPEFERTGDETAADDEAGTEEGETDEADEGEPRPAVTRPEAEHVEQGPTARASPPEEEPPADEETAPSPTGAEPTTSGEGVDPLPGESLARFQVYRDRGGKWRWRLVHRNGNIVASSGQGYTTRRSAEKGMRSVMQNAPGAAVEREGASGDAERSGESDG